MFCSQCGTQYDDGAPACPSCGTPAKQPDAAQPEVLQAQPISPVAPPAPQATFSAGFQQTPPGPTGQPQAQFQATYTPPPPSTPPADPPGAMVGMVMGIVSIAVLILLACPTGGLLSFISIITGAIGMVFSKKANSISKTSKASFGFISSIIVLILSVLFFLFWVIVLIIFGGEIARYL